MGERTLNKYYTSKQRSFKAQAEDNITQGLEDEFNLNAFYLSEIGFLMSEWRLLNLYGIQGTLYNLAYFDREIMILDGLLDLLSPKITSEEEESYDTKIRNYDNNTKKIFRETSSGKMLMNRELFDSTKKEIRVLYRELLRKLQEKGMLTKIQADPKLAMGDID